MSARQDCAPGRAGGEGARGDTKQDTANDSAIARPPQAPRLNVRRVRQAAEQALALVNQLDRDTWPDNPRYCTIRYISIVLAEAIEELTDYEYLSSEATS